MSAKILVVEDNPANRELATYLLRAFGHTTVEARDGVEGWEAARREPFDLFLCDVHLPRRDGCELARMLKADPELKKVPLVAITALALMGDRARVMEAGFDGYISKPIVPETFVREIESFVERGQHGAPPAKP